MKLAEKKCPSCSGDVPALSREQIAELFPQLSGWELEQDRKLVKTYSFSNFAKPMALANKIAEIAEQENHHPDLMVSWGKLTVQIWTHANGALTESDFILAAKIDQLA